MGQQTDQDTGRELESMNQESEDLKQIFQQSNDNLALLFSVDLRAVWEADGLSKMLGLLMELHQQGRISSRTYIRITRAVIDRQIEITRYWQQRVEQEMKTGLGGS